MWKRKDALLLRKLINLSIFKESGELEMASVFLKATIKIKDNYNLKLANVNGQHGNSGFPL